MTSFSSDTSKMTLKGRGLTDDNALSSGIGDVMTNISMNILEKMFHDWMEKF
jgi:hypothetical protein